MGGGSFREMAKNIYGGCKCAGVTSATEHLGIWGERGNGVLSFSAFAFYVNVDFFFSFDSHIVCVDMTESYYLKNLERTINNGGVIANMLMFVTKSTSSFESLICLYYINHRRESAHNTNPMNNYLRKNIYIIICCV